MKSLDGLDGLDGLDVSFDGLDIPLFINFLYIFAENILVFLEIVTKMKIDASCLLNAPSWSPKIK